MLGHIDGDGVQIYRRPSRRHAPDTEFEVAGLGGLPRVDIAYSYAGADGTVVDALVAAGANGIVSAGLAPGIPTPLERAALERARDAGIVVVQSSRAGSGRVALRRYLEEAGMVAADNLNPQKARILLMLALTRPMSATSAACSRPIEFLRYCAATRTSASSARRRSETGSGRDFWSAAVSTACRRRAPGCSRQASARGRSAAASAARRAGAAPPAR